MRQTAIIVDDEPIARMDFADILERAGFEVAAQCSDGFDAIEACRIHRPDVALMDIKMPVFDGLSSAETIIKESLAGCVVLLTAFSDHEFIERAKQIGVAGYLVKPVEERTLLPTIEIAIAQSKRYDRAVEEAESMRAKMEEKSLIDRAKRIVAARDSISEGDAYAQIQKMGMTKRLPMAEIARVIVQTGDDRGPVNEAKQVLMSRHGIGESAAYKRLKVLSEQRSCTVAEAAREIIAAK